MRMLNKLIFLCCFTSAAAISLAKELVCKPEPPCYSGVRYKAKIPDTLDLASRCGLALDCMTSVVNPDNHYSLYFFAAFGREPAYLSHNEWRGNTVKFMELLPAMRVASGNMTAPECEASWIGSLLDEPLCGGRLLGMASYYYLLTGDDRYKEHGIKSVDLSVAAAVKTGEKAYFSIPQRIPGANPLTDPNINFHTYLWTVDALARFYRAAGYRPAIDLATGLTRTQLSSESYYYNGHENGSFADEPIMWYGITGKQHFHCNTLMRLSALDYAVTANDTPVIEWVYKGYEFAKQHGDPITGWFPEAISPGKVNAVYNICEMCATGDMVQLALRLAQNGYDGCWDDADRWIRNALAEGQLLDVDWLKNYWQSDFAKAAAAYDAEHTHPGQTYRDYVLEKHPDAVFENAARRCIGGFGGWVAYNDWFGGHNLMQGLAIMHCCTANCARALYAAFDSTSQYDLKTNTLSIYLLLNKASRYADIDSFIPYTGRINIKTKQAINLRIRIPDYVDLSDVRIQQNGKTIKPTYSGRYAQVADVPAKAAVHVQFPLKTQTKTVRLRYYEPDFWIGEYYTLQIKGNTVIDICPKGQYLPLYQRSRYNGRVKYKTVERFVSDTELPW